MGINNTKVTEILQSNDKGIGKTASLPELYGFNADGTEFSVKNIGTAQVTTDLIAAKFVQLYHAFIKDMDEEKKLDHLKALTANCVDLNQYRGLNKEVKGKKAVTVTAEHLLTPEQYKRNCIKIALATVTVEEIEELFFYHDIKALFFTDEQELTYITMLERDELAVKRFEALTQAGFSKVIELKDNVIQATVTFTQASEAIPALAKLGYVLVKSLPDMATMSVTVFFKAGEAEKLV